MERGDLMDNNELRSEIKKLVIKMKSEDIKMKSKDNEKLIPIEASGRHVHLSSSDLEKLFGSGYNLTEKRELSQPGQFLAEERVRLIGPKNVTENVAILGPTRDSTQVELSMTDAVSLGVDAPLRLSGDIEDSAPLFIASAKNMIKINEGVIIAKCHIHMTSADAESLNLKDKEIVNVEALTERPLIFKNVLVRVNQDYKLNMHLDYDQANACLLKKGDMGRIIKTGRIEDD